MGKSEKLNSFYPPRHKMFPDNFLRPKSKFCSRQFCSESLLPAGADRCEVWVRGQVATLPTNWNEKGHFGAIYQLYLPNGHKKRQKGQKRMKRVTLGQFTNFSFPPTPPRHCCLIPNNLQEGQGLIFAKKKKN